MLHCYLKSADDVITLFNIVVAKITKLTYLNRVIHVPVICFHSYLLAFLRYIFHIFTNKITQWSFGAPCIWKRKRWVWQKIGKSKNISQLHHYNQDKIWGKNQKPGKRVEQEFVQIYSTGMGSRKTFKTIEKNLWKLFQLQSCDIMNLEKFD